MGSVGELSGPYGNYLLGPRRGSGVCELCFNLTDGFRLCYACSHGEAHLDAMLPISYSVATGQLHHALRGYKRFGGDAARWLSLGLAAVLWRFLVRHETCLARAARVASFDLVTTVPSGDAARDQAGPHPLASLVADTVGPTRGRYARLLVRSGRAVKPRTFDAGRFSAISRTAVRDRSVLLIDDTWTTGASGQSAAAALKAAGATAVAGLVIGRHINPEWHDNSERLRAIPLPFDWESCALCSPA